MKIRIRENSIRFRLTKSEVDELAEKGELIQQTHFPDGHGITFQYGLKSHHHGNDIRADHQNNGIIISLPAEHLSHWAKTEEVGIESFLPIAQDERLRILIEKDFACLTAQEHENDSDAFANPNETC